MARMGEVLQEMRAKWGSGDRAQSQAHAAEAEAGAGVCPVCEGLGYVYDEAWRLVPCPALREHAERHALAREMAGLPAWWTTELAAVTPASPKQAALVRLVGQVLASGGGVYVYGPPGRGKTLLLRAAVWTATLDGRRARYVRMSDLLGELRDAVGDRRQRVTEVRRRWAMVPVLAIDEPEKARPDTDFAREHLFSLFDERFEGARAGLVTLLASNEPPEFFGPYLASRFRARREGFFALALDDLEDMRR